MFFFCELAGKSENNFDSALTSLESKFAYDMSLFLLALCLSLSFSISFPLSLYTELDYFQF